MADAGLSDADVAAMNKGWFETMTAVRDKLRAVGKVRSASVWVCGWWLLAYQYPYLHLLRVPVHQTPLAPAACCLACACAPLVFCPTEVSSRARLEPESGCGAVCCCC